MPPKNEKKGPKTKEAVVEQPVKAKEKVVVSLDEYEQAVKDGKAEFLVANITLCKEGTITKDAVSKMLTAQGGVKAVLENFSKLKDIGPDTLAEMIIDAGKGTSALYNNEVDFTKSMKELALVEKDRLDIYKSAKANAMKDGRVDDAVLASNLSNHQNYPALLSKEKALEDKTKKQEKFIMKLDKNALFTKCLETKNFFTPQNMAFFVKDNEGNRAVRGLESAIILIVESKKYDKAHINALLSNAADATTVVDTTGTMTRNGLSEDLYNSLKNNGFEDSTVSYAKKFNLPEGIKEKEVISDVY